MRRAVGTLAAILLLITACSPVTSRSAAISAGERAVGAVQVTRVDAKELTWADWQQRSGNRGGPVPGPPDSTRIWAVAIQGHLSKLRNVTAGVAILNAATGDMIMATTDGHNWPPYWDSL